MPTLTRKNVSLIGISTLASTYNFWNKLIEIVKDDGTPLFKCFRYEMVCDSCKAKGEEMACRHKLGELPYWLSADQYRDIQKMMEDYAESFMAELMGLQRDPSEVEIFEVEYVNALATAPTYEGLITRTIYVGVDPGSSSYSDYAVCSTMVSTEGDTIIVGLEAIGYTTPFEPTWVIDHCKALRKIPEFATAHIVIGVESNGGTERDHQKYQIDSSSLKNVTFLMESGKGVRPGIFTDDKMKEAVSRRAKEAIEFGRVRFHRHLTCVRSGDRVTPSMMKEKFLTQLSMFKRVTIKSNKEYIRGKIIYTGKLHGGNDDMVMSWYLSLHGRTLFEENKEKYRTLGLGGGDMAALGQSGFEGSKRFALF